MNTQTMTPQTSKPKQRRDVRPLALTLILVLIVIIGWGLQWRSSTSISSAPGTVTLSESARELPAEFNPVDASPAQEAASSAETVWTQPPEPIDPQQDPGGHMQQARSQEVAIRFQQGLAMLHAKRFDEAIVALQRMLRLVPYSADGQVNLGYALLGKENYAAAFAAFDRASDLNPAQANAYYGAAIALEGMGNLEGALSGMRSFLHLTDNGPGQIHVARARSAIWEWESQLKRGPWGPTQGIPPGFTRDELKRDGRGVGVKMPIAGTEDEYGFKQYEIKLSDKYELFDR